jgi:RHS repeat-associated protein
VAITTASGLSSRFTFDALGRHASRTVDVQPVESYSYLGSSQAVVAIETTAGRTTSFIDGLGARVANSSGGTLSWSLTDLHGNVAGTLSADGTSVTTAYRYDAWGTTVDQYSIGGAAGSPWRFQGRLLESGPGMAELYDFGSRSYAPGLGAFTSLDSVAGSSDNPLSLNRYLYARANPVTYIDPTGHDPCYANSPESAAACARHDAGAGAASRKTKRSGKSTSSSTSAKPTCTTDSTDYGRCYRPENGGQGGNYVSDDVIAAATANLQAELDATIQAQACGDSGNYARGCTGAEGDTSMRNLKWEYHAPKRQERQKFDCGWNPFCYAGDAAGWTGDRLNDAKNWTGDRLNDAKNWAGDRWKDGTAQFAIAIGIPLLLGAACAVTMGAACVAALAAGISVAGDAGAQCITGACSGTKDWDTTSMMISSAGGAVTGPAMAGRPILAQTAMGAVSASAQYGTTQVVEGKQINPGVMLWRGIFGGASPWIGPFLKWNSRGKWSPGEYSDVTNIYQTLNGVLNGASTSERR